ncbi:MAG: hypothetical protein JXA24_00690 [Proteobacteria bacterium]|nr:hypothetical protein [Pseudomonadota bacterium]
MKEMRVKGRVLRALGALIPMVFVFVSGYGGGGTQPATVDLTGSWNIVETIIQATGVCAGNIGRVSNWSCDAVQTGNDVDVTVTAGDNVGSVFSGTVSGNEIDWQGEYASDGGTVTVTGTDITATDTTFEGTSDWEWTDGDDSCSGKTQVAGTKVL